MLRIVVGFPPGGGYDTYSRLIARHVGRHIPGSPKHPRRESDRGRQFDRRQTYLPRCKTGGLSIGHFIGGLFLQQLLGKSGIEFDARRLEYIGAPAQDNFVMGLARATGITSAQQWIASKTVIKFVGFGAGTDDIPAVAREVTGLPIQLVTGYKGTNDIRLAFNNCEIQGINNSWQSIRSTWRNELDTGQLQIIMQVATKSHPELTKYPLSGDFIKTEDGKRLLQAVTQVHGESVRPYVAAPNTPKERVRLLCKAFDDTMKDAEFLAEADKGKIDIKPVSGEELEKSVLNVLQLEPGLVAKLKDIIQS